MNRCANELARIALVLFAAKADFHTNQILSSTPLSVGIPPAQLLVVRALALWKIRRFLLSSVLLITNALLTKKLY